MTDVNSTVFNGRLVKDAELHSFSEKNAVIQFTICVNNQKKEGDKWVDKPCFFPVKKYGSNMDKLASYLTKGKQVSIQGHLDQDKWEKDGKQNSMTYIVADKLQLLGSSNKESSNQQQELPPDETYSEDGNFPEDIPF